MQRADANVKALPVNEKQRIESLVNAGKLDHARKHAERLCRKFRDNPEAWFLLGAVCGSQGDYKHAVNCCRRTTLLAPQVAIGHFNLGVALNRVGRAREAVPPLRKALQLQPMMPEALRELGNAHAMLGEYDQALEPLSRLAEYQPGDTAAWIAQGNLHEKLANLPAAERCYRKAMETGPHSVGARMNLGNVLKLLERTDEAEQCYRSLLDEVPGNADVIYNLAVLYQSCCRYADAETRYREVLGINPAHESSLNNLGLVLMALSRLDESVVVFTRLLGIKPGDFDAMRNLSQVFREQNRPDLAEEQLNSILSSDPDNIPARQDRSLVWLQQGRLDKGWNEYEWRNAGVAVSDRWPFPPWDGKKSSDSTVLVYPEQGIGDEIMFSSCILDLTRATSRVILVCNERLESLFQRSFPTASVMGRTLEQGAAWLEQLPCVDAQVSIASLPKYFRRRVEDFSKVNRAYLLAAPGALQKWQSRYAALGDGLKIGLSWHGGHLSNTKLKRSIPLEQWSDVLRVSNVHFVNLQYGDCAEELEHAHQQYAVRVHEWEDSNPLVDMDDFSAKVQALDLVLSIDNSTAHLAGALGVRTWILQPFSPDWRWLPDQEGSNWYPAVKQYRQAVPGEWNGVLVRVAEALTCLSCGDRK
ncbi:MAG: tetratricopeptide repeat protein [Gammaproteobacteria bacterium]|nr:MAG: tetratricopeptide repeat protein [Gammaproteobacteria bacterium]